MLIRNLILLDQVPKKSHGCSAAGELIVVNVSKKMKGPLVWRTGACGPLPRRVAAQRPLTILLTTRSLQSVGIPAERYGSYDEADISGNETSTGGGQKKGKSSSNSDWPKVAAGQLQLAAILHAPARIYAAVRLTLSSAALQDFFTDDDPASHIWFTERECQWLGRSFA